MVSTGWVFAQPSYIEKFASKEVVELRDKWYDHPYFADKKFKEGIEVTSKKAFEFLAGLGFEYDEQKGMYKCKNCQAREYTKAGFVKGNQPYKFKKCGCQFVPIRQKGKSEQEKLVAIWLCVHVFSFRTIAKFLKICDRYVFVWVKAFTEKLCKTRAYKRESDHLT